jgi:glycosyltransferase involved in cell wall biosynthesis
VAPRHRPPRRRRIDRADRRVHLREAKRIPEGATMRIALVSTSAISVPPKAYGGTELFVYELSKMLTKRGHDVTVYATGDSRPAARLKSHFEEAIWPPDDHAELRHVSHAWNDIVAHVPRFDVVHVNQIHALPFAARHALPTVMTLHHPRDEELVSFYPDFPEVSYAGISVRQLETMPEVPAHFVVHHGLDPALYPLGRGDGGYCAFLGRLAPEKGPHHAIDAARLAHVPLRIGGVPHWVNMKFYDDEIEPRVDAAGTLVDYLGELSHQPKLDLLRHARALLFPIEWEEPFGLVMIEAMLVGTPVIAFPWGSVREVVDEGVTGFIVNDVREMAECMRRLRSFDRQRCREHAVRRWSSMRMAHDYEKVYAEVSGPRVREAVRSGRFRKPAPLRFEQVQSLASPDRTSASGLFSPFFKTKSA